METSDVNYIWEPWILSDPRRRKQQKKPYDFAVSSTPTAYAKRRLKWLIMYVCSQVRDGAMSDLQTQLREVLRENELLRRDVSMASNII